MTKKVDLRVQDELEALESILIDRLTVKEESGVPKFVESIILPSTADRSEIQYVCVTLEVKLTPNYPESRPEVRLKNSRGLDDQLLSTIKSRIEELLDINLGNPVLYDLIEVTREYLTQSNLPSGQCVICLYGFAQGDVFIKTPCYHHFHSHCLSKHLIAGRKYHKEEFEKLPTWQQIQAKPYQQTCPVCRCAISFDVDKLKKAPPPVDSVTAPPFRLTPELKALQQRMATLLARQVAHGGVVGVGDNGPPPLTITSPTDNEEGNESTRRAQENSRPGSNVAADNAPSSPQSQVPYQGPFRGFNRRGKPGRRGRGGR